MAPKSKSYAKVNVERLKLEDLNPAEYNSRLITQDALAGLAKSIEHLGLLAFPIVNKRADGYRIVGGHQRVKVLADQDVKEVDCIVVEFDDETERKANFALNNKAIQGDFIPEMTKALLDEIRAKTEGTTAVFMFDDLRFESLLKQIARNVKPQAGVDDIERAGRTDDDATVSIARSSADSKLGRYYKLGEHVLFCGKANAKTMLKGFPCERADAAFALLAGKNGITQEYLDSMLMPLLANTDGAVYIATNFQTLPLLQDRFRQLGGHWSNTLIWYAPDAKGAAGSVYRDVTIPVLYGWRDGAPHYYCGVRDQGNTFKLRKPAKSDLPVEVAVKAFLSSTRAKAFVLDLDIGNGATLIAAEKTNRRMVGFVGSPRDMDAVRKRWTEFVHEGGTNWKSATPAL